MLNKKKILIPAAALIIIILLVFNIVNYLKLRNLSESLDKNTELILDESTANRRTGDYLNNISGMIAHDLNRTRASLGLAVRNYPFKSINDGGPEAQEAVENNPIIDAVSVLLDAESENKKSSMLGRFLRNELIDEYFEESESVYDKIDNLTFHLKYKDELYLVIKAEDETSIKLQGMNGEELITASASKEAVHFISRNLEELKIHIKEKDALSVMLMKAADEPDVLSVLGNDKKIVKGDNLLTVNNKNNGNNINAVIECRGFESFFRISGLNEEFKDYKAFVDAFCGKIEEMDTRNSEQVLLDNARQELESMIAQKDFLEYIASLGLTISSTPRDDLDYFYYDISHSDGNRLGSLAILKKVGEIYLVDADEVPVSSLKTLSIKKTIESSRSDKMIIPENIPEIDSLYSNQDTVTFLLVGNHELNTDTMILVHANKITGKAYMIGIPRDLYWKGRKINSIYQYFGAEQFKKELSDITGLEITNYIIVDMYAFIDIVNILGGIELTLDEDLVDPTYKTRENGEWSTLNYPKGTYNLNGIEALRVARSRHGSNDFDRSKRQQLIIEAFLNKILELKISDVDKVYGMIQAMFEYVDTDFTLVEMLSLFNNYSDVQLAGKHVLSFDNILYDTYSNIYMLEDQDIDFGEDFNKGAWILFPRDNNWNNIRWYVRQIINGEI